MRALSQKTLLIAVLGSLIFSMGCEGCKEQIKSLVYKEVDRTVPVGEKKDEEESLLAGPNDRPENARVIRVTREMGSVSGKIESPGQVGWYSLERGGDEDWIVEFKVSPEDEGFDPAIYLEIEEEGGAAPLLYDVAGPGEPELVPMVRVPGGGKARFFIAGQGETTGAYRIEVRRRLLAGNIAIEPNDTPRLATILEVPGEVQGFYERPFDKDIFFVPREDLEAGIYSLEVSQLPEMPQELKIYNDKSLQAPILALNVGTRAPAIIPNISLSAGEGDGLYFVLSAGEAYSRQQSYRLRVIKHPPGEGFHVEREPNDLAELAQYVDLGQRLRGYLHTAQDIDRFRFQIGGADRAEEGDEGSEEGLLAEIVTEEEADDERELEEQVFVDPWEAVPEKEQPEHVVQVWLNPLAEAHRLAMRWLPGLETGEQSISLEADDEKQSLVLCNHVLGPGTYGVEVRALETQEGFRIRSFDYELEFKNIAGEAGLEVEPNDSLERADRLYMGQERVGYISTAGDVDYYAFLVGQEKPEERPVEELMGQAIIEQDESAALEEDESAADGVALAGPTMAWEPPPMESVEIQLRGNRLNLGFELLDDEGGRVARVDQRGPGGDEELIIDLPQGLYYLAVRASNGSICEPYRIEINMK